VKQKCLKNGVEDIHSVGTVNNVETSYFTLLKICYIMTTFRCLSDILITSWLFRARWSTWSGNHLVPCVAELVGSWFMHIGVFLIQSASYPSGLSLCLSVDQFCLVPVNDMVLFQGMVCDGWLVSYTALPCPGHRQEVQSEDQGTQVRNGLFHSWYTDSSLQGKGGQCNSQCQLSQTMLWKRTMSSTGTR